MKAEELQALWREIPADQRPKDGAAFAALLAKRGVLTEFQGRQVDQGRGAALVMGDYLILDRIGAGGGSPSRNEHHGKTGPARAGPVERQHAYQGD